MSKIVSNLTIFGSVLLAAVLLYSAQSKLTDKFTPFEHLQQLDMAVAQKRNAQLPESIRNSEPAQILQFLGGLDCFGAFLLLVSKQSRIAGSLLTTFFMADTLHKSKFVGLITREVSLACLAIAIFVLVSCSATLLSPEDWKVPPEAVSIDKKNK